MHYPLRLLCVLAHPDDESMAFGGILAKYGKEDVETSLILATRGERGWFGDPAAYPGEQQLGAMREREAREACAQLGVSRLSFLDYCDGDLDQANAIEVINKITILIRQIRPHVVLTFGPDGLYGHPDHIAISQFTTSAVVNAANPSYQCTYDLPPHCVSKLYYRTAVQEWFNTFALAFGDPVMSIDGQERRAYTWIPWTVTTRIETTACWQQVWQAIKCHQTQLRYPQALAALSLQDHINLWGTQEFYRVFSLVNGGRQEEHDLFAGLRASQPDIQLLDTEPLFVQQYIESH